MAKKPNWQRANQMVILKHGRGVELKTYEKTLQVAPVV